MTGPITAPGTPVIDSSQGRLIRTSPASNPLPSSPGSQRDVFSPSNGPSSAFRDFTGTDVSSPGASTAEKLNVPFSIYDTSLLLANNPELIDQVLQQASDLDATGGIRPVTADGKPTGVTASASTAGLYDITPKTVGTFNWSSKVLENINTIKTFIETNDVKAYQSALKQEGATISDEESAQLFNRVQKNQALINTALTQSVPREQARNQSLQNAQQKTQQASNINLAQPKINNAGGGQP